jgi:transposase
MKTAKGERVRMREPVREQGEMQLFFLDDVIGAEHPARLLWRVVEGLQLDAFVAEARAVEGEQGRDRISVRMLLALWLYATSQGIGSAREIERRMVEDAPFRWIAGGLKVGRTKLAAFRVEHRDALDKTLTDVLAMLMHKGLLSLTLVAQDGTRVRANASAPSFRRLESLEGCREQAALHVKAVLAANEDSEESLCIKRAREAAARDYERRVLEAIGELKELREERAQQHRAKTSQTRVSTTDPEARVMKMPDGGFRPAYNIQLATAGSALGGPRTIVGVQVTNLGSDVGALVPMLDDIERRTGQQPLTLLADGNHADHASIREAAQRGVEVLIPVPDKVSESGKRAADDLPIQQWKQRMDTAEAKQTYRARASLCELPNAQLKGRFGLAAVAVRGLYKVTCVALLAALTANLLAHGAALLT